MAASTRGPEPPARRVLVLCFDGTGNQFTGKAADSNIVKIFKCLDAENPNVFRYYQPGIGTYVASSKLSKTSRWSKMHSAYKKITDQMYGTSFDEHVQAGYQFLMRYYEEDSDIYFFGFSRGAYTARFLAQMLDCVGLLSTGNEEMFRFAWKAFSQWQSRVEATEEQKRKKDELFEFMKQFRTTFGRPIRRIRFMGLFDTVNSVPRFESKWMSRSKFPYVSKSSAKVVRHVVAIDERRAKFRQNLLSQQRPHQYPHDGTHHLQQAMHMFEHPIHHHGAPAHENGVAEKKEERPHLTKRQTFDRFKPRRTHRMKPPLSAQVSVNSTTNVDQYHTERAGSLMEDEEEDEDDEDAPQDIQEVWFPGSHGDIGGGWQLREGEVPLSYPPLIWILREARKAGLPFDEDTLRDEGHFFDEIERRMDESAPKLELEGQPIDNSAANRTSFLGKLESAVNDSVLHDCLEYGRGLSATGVTAWNIMEYMPFRRMDLKADGTWAPIRWPLPCGEPRDIPAEAVIHYSAIRRIHNDSTYRPGNLIIGGGGRGVKIAPASAGNGHWKVLREEGDPIGEAFVKDATQAAIQK